VTRCFSSSDDDSLCNSIDDTDSLLFPRFNPSDYILHTPPQYLNGVIPNLKKHQRIVSFGDVHGDFMALVSFLVTAKVMQAPDSLEEALKNPKWIGGDTICVSCGDIMDRGPNELACLRLLSNISLQSAAAGGALIVLYGNHEVLNSAGMFHYVDPNGNVEMERSIGCALDSQLGHNRWRLQFGGNEPSRWAAFEPGGLLSDGCLSKMNVAVVLGRNVFVHAGLTKEHLEEFGGVLGMNKLARDWIIRVHHKENNNDGDYKGAKEIIAAAESRSQAANKAMPNCIGGGIGSPSPVWMRDYSQPHDGPPRNAMAQEMIDAALEELGNDVQRMVVGHTPQSYINSALKGKAWRIDVGASKGVMSGTPEVLEIIHGGDDENDEVYVLTREGERIPGKYRHVMDDALI